MKILQQPRPGLRFGQRRSESGQGDFNLRPLPGTLRQDSRNAQVALILDVVFEMAREADADALLVMTRAFHNEDGHPLDQMGEAAVVQVAKGDPFARAWILRRGRAAVGYVVITLGFSIEYGGRDGFIDDFYLVPEARGHGLGGKLLEFTLTEAAALGIRTLHLEVEPENEYASRLYRRAGFEATSRRLMRLRLRS